jgi:hypothetical protein
MINVLYANLIVQGVYNHTVEGLNGTENGLQKGIGFLAGDTIKVSFDGIKQILRYTNVLGFII